MTSESESRSGTDPIPELQSWLKSNWNPDLTVGEWWERLGLEGWASPMLAPNAYGRGLSRSDAVRVAGAIDGFGALGAPGGLGTLLAAPTIATHGTQAQIDRFVKPIVTGQHAWCQLFSEPGAGSDLAGLTTKAVRDGDDWVVTGQKVWTSGGQVADMGMLIARTDPDVPKHGGISYFAISMHQGSAVEVRPLREITWHAHFNEVFLDEARVGDDARIGEINNGWAVANATLGFERAGLGAGGGHASSTATPGTIAGHLGLRVGDFVGEVEETDGPLALLGIATDLLFQMVRRRGGVDDPVLRQELMKMYSLGEIGRLGALRAKALRQAGMPDIPGLGNIAKLSASRLAQYAREIGLALIGPYGTLYAYHPEQAEALHAAGVDSSLTDIVGMGLVSTGPSIYGGTDQIQRNIIGERVLGLPKEANNDRTTAFRDLPKNG